MPEPDDLLHKHLRINERVVIHSTGNPDLDGVAGVVVGYYTPGKEPKRTIVRLDKTLSGGDTAVCKGDDCLKREVAG